MSENEPVTEVTDTASPAPAPKAKPVHWRVKRAQKADADAVAALSTDKGKALVAEAVEKTVAEIMAKLNVAREDAGTDARPSDLSVIEQLAHTLIDMSDQGSQRAPKLTPAQKLERENAREEMQGLIVAALADNQAPTYQLTRAVYFAEQLIEPTYRDSARVNRVTVIDWAGVPDESMVPQNDTAEKIMSAYIRSIGGRTKESKVPYKKAHQAPELRVHGRETPVPVSQARYDPDHSGLKVHRPGLPGQVEQIRVLGTIASPSRQIAA